MIIRTFTPVATCVWLGDTELNSRSMNVKQDSQHSPQYVTCGGVDDTVLHSTVLVSQS